MPDDDCRCPEDLRLWLRHILICLYCEKPRRGRDSSPSHATLHARSTLRDIGLRLRNVQNDMGDIETALKLHRYEQADRDRELDEMSHDRVVHAQLSLAWTALATEERTLLQRIDDYFTR